MRKIGIYGGTFDPIHLGHIAVAIALIEQRGLDHIFFVPAAQNPFKTEGVQTAAKHRYAMAELALAGVPRTSIVSLEIEREGLSFTINTVKELISSGRVQQEDALFLILGEDQLRDLHKWRAIHELVLLASPLIAKRSGEFPEGEWKKDPLLVNSIENGMCNTPLFDISATQIRNRLKKGLFCGHLLHPSVLQYIQQYTLYE